MQRNYLHDNEYDSLASDIRELISLLVSILKTRDA